MKLHDYQWVAVDHLRRHRGAALFLDMGLGKTAAALTALTPDHLPALVIAPKRVAENVWSAEARTWRPDLKVRVAAGRAERRIEELGAAADVTVISRDNAGDALQFAGRWNTVILDELSGYKSSRTRRHRVARKLVAGVPHVWGLTGTPSPNGLLDLWAQLFLLDGGKRLGKTLTGYRERYFTPGRQLANGVITGWNLRPGADTRIHTLLEDVCLSMSSDGRIDLPAVTYNTVTVPLPANVRSLYKRFKRDLVVNLDLLGGEVHTAANAAVLSSKLAQLTAGFMYVDDADLRGRAYTAVHSEKVTALREIIDGTGSPVLVFYRFRAEAEMIRKALPGLVHSIDEPNAVERWNAGQLPVLLDHPASIGHGLNLQYGGHTIVWASLPWSLEEWKQANARLARQGQRHPVVIHVLSAPRTVDDAVYDALRDKTRVEAALLAHLEHRL